jgi:hypothetical protein
LDNFSEFETILEGIENKEVLSNYMSEDVYMWLMDKKIRMELYGA